MILSKSANFTATRNACKLCTPLGACFVFRGIEGAVPFLHGSQGCATYIRRYMISHFKEPMDIASSNFGEASAIFGGKDNLSEGLDNVIRQYAPSLIGLATTCLAETIGEDLNLLLSEYRKAHATRDLPTIVPVSTPSYNGTHADGFHGAVRAVIKELTKRGEHGSHVNLLPGLVSPADLRHLREIIDAFGLEPIILPDYSETLDGGVWEEYQRIPPGGTPIEDVRRAGSAARTIEFGATCDFANSAGALLEHEFGVPRRTMRLPIGVQATDAFFKALECVGNAVTPPEHERERSRLIDAMVDAHKYVFGKRAIVFGEEDLVVAMAAFLAEIGIAPVLCASGGHSGRLQSEVRRVTAHISNEILVREDMDFLGIEELTRQLEPDLLIGNSKGYTLSRKLDVPLIRVGFPIHDRIGGARLLHVGYRGTQHLFDRITNAVIEKKQKRSSVGYTYM